MLGLGALIKKYTFLNEFGDDLFFCGASQSFPSISVPLSLVRSLRHGIGEFRDAHRARFACGDDFSRGRLARGSVRGTELFQAKTSATSTHRAGSGLTAQNQD